MKKLTYRRAWHSDVEAITDLAMESLSKGTWNVEADRRLVERSIRDGINTQDYGWVAERDGVIVGAVGAYANWSEWHGGQTLDIALYYGTAPGAVTQLVRHMIAWAESNPDIRTINVTLETDASPATRRMFESVGLTQASTTLTRIME